MYSGKSKFQEVDLIHTGPFGKARRNSPGAGGGVMGAGPLRLMCHLDGGGGAIVTALWP
jgi:hypothetical protein